MKLIVVLTAAALLSAPAMSASCRDAKGKFIKCPTAAAPAVTKDPKGKCRFSSGPKKGQFTKCP
ncbi:hypothetical protein [Sphingomonas sp.]|uniref:hypothetical protein n=1 Tax=Sphingomonas sp. TaxID=28214 RepID=UPI003B3B9BF3